MNQRDISIDILKFIAVFLIINSHMDALYPKYKMLATGGAIGDVLFLFASGYTLFLSNRKLRFDNWYKRRINRIYRRYRKKRKRKFSDKWIYKLSWRNPRKKS